jgi:trans-2,3-dihydro-3-hydroxyanthranilate isomerase
MRHLLVPTDHPLESLRIDAAALVPAARAVNTTGVVPFRVIDDTTIHMRAIIPSEMVTFEDPGTGSAAGPVGVLARKLYGIGADILVRQGDEIGRPSRITVHAEPGDVRVRGDVSASARGTFTFA